MKTAGVLPAEVKPCSQCGRCCQEEVCDIGHQIFATDKAPCPGLEFKGGKYWCRLVPITDSLGKSYRNAFALELGIGVGCDAEFEEA
ncbi:hypothetical protein LCGC14_0984950 [marine sediment metagenome]|uniref:Uncharacterized protein n=1 Tax=marine sediment metagenome TaxID=412755 RepID=A0A0F9N7I9_9ZZZZ